MKLHGQVESSPKIEHRFTSTPSWFITTLAKRIGWVSNGKKHEKRLYSGVRKLFEPLNLVTSPLMAVLGASVPSVDQAESIPDSKVKRMPFSLLFADLDIQPA